MLPSAHRSKPVLYVFQEPALIAEEVHGRVLSMVNLCNLRGLRRLLLCHSPNPDEIRCAGRSIEYMCL